MHAPATGPIPSDLLLLAYRNGIFPMADARDDPEVFWVEPRERAIIPLDGFAASHSLRKVLRRSAFFVTCNRAFGDVLRACAAPRGDREGTWINRRIEASFAALHREGHAHSLECWRDGELVGGLYGLAIDRAFCGESMFSRADNASKVALAWLVALLRRAGFVLLDCQFMTSHLASLGAVETSQAHYCALLADAGGAPRLSLPEAYASLLSEAESSSSSPGKLIAQSLTQTS
ncbi:leucyl/phenylalanyl-tRNA--protein transferase [Pelagerythrobacter sp.]|uniref:leucyl/phenylalanyl-tRNA--protein transferase n=1 Tax=Pelagerythrobacter sp. TaxID=2800702 RepID=UPI0035B2FD29